MSESTGGRPLTNHIIKLDMAKEISMIRIKKKDYSNLHCNLYIYL
ncbi:antA/AntB antirepressor family protein [Metasolibacillus meyeri]|nr:antA/AntB antirepressor family protein [Metasolibacillus meyeri]